MIRLVDSDDLLGVLDLYKQLRPHDPELDRQYAQQQWHQIIHDPQTHIVVAEVDGEVASTCALGINNSIANGARPFGIIEHVVTAQKFRRRGLSRQVLEFAIALAWEKNCYKVMLLSGELLTSAHALYESVGFNVLFVSRGIYCLPFF